MAESNTIIFKDFQACRSGLKIFDSTVYFINTHVNTSFFIIHEYILYSNTYKKKLVHIWCTEINRDYCYIMDVTLTAIL